MTEGRFVAVASGKGGVGKTWFAITLAHACARDGRRVLLFDGDLGLANVDIQLGLTAVHDGIRSFGNLLQAVGKGEWDGETFTELVQVEHPVVRTHPETGRRNLFVNPGFTKRIKGLKSRESEAILQLLYRHMTLPEYVVRYRWEEGDLGFWDNRTTMHYAIRDYGDAHRVIQRVTIRGDRPY